MLDSMTRPMRLAAGAAMLCATLSSAPALANAGTTIGNDRPGMTGPRYDVASEYRSGIAALEAQDYAQAERHFRRVVRATNDHAPAYYMLGEAQLQQNELRDARGNFQQALRVENAHVGARQQLAVTYALLGEEDAALAELNTLRSRREACAETCPQAADLTQAVQTLEAFFFGGGEETGSLTEPAAPETRLASAEIGDAAYLQAVALINEGRYEAALAEFRRAETVFGPHPDVLTYIGFTNRRLGRYDVAERYYTLALSIDPEHRGALEYYGELHVERGDVATAEAYLERLEALCAFGCAQADELRDWIADSEI